MSFPVSTVDERRKKSPGLINDHIRFCPGNFASLEVLLPPTLCFSHLSLPHSCPCTCFIAFLVSPILQNLASKHASEPACMHARHDTVEHVQGTRYGEASGHCRPEACKPHAPVRSRHERRRVTSDPQQYEATPSYQRSTRYRAFWRGRVVSVSM